MADKLEREALAVSSRLLTVVDGQDQYVALGSLMGVFATQLASVYGHEAVTKFDSEYADVIRSLVTAALNRQQ